MSNMAHDLLVKNVCDFYAEKEIDHAKKLLFENCELRYQGSMPLRKRVGPSKSVNNVKDILSKLNEASTKSPIYVAEKLLRIPSLTMEMFDLAKVLNELNQLKISREFAEVPTMIEVMRCLAQDMKSMSEKLSKLDSKENEIELIKSVVCDKSTNLQGEVNTASVDEIMTGDLLNVVVQSSTEPPLSDDISSDIESDDQTK